jgi:tetratricopeptide (TPR) repeat protein
VSIWQAQVARAEAANARNAEESARKEAENAREAKSVAEEERQTADETINFIKAVLAYGTSAGQGGKDPKRAPTVREALDRAAQSIAGRFKDRPLVEAKVRKTVGEVYYRLQAYDQAVTQYERILELRRATLGPDDENTWAAMNDLGEVYKRLKRYEEAEELLKSALASKRAKLGNDNRSTQRTVNNLGGLYRELKRFEEAEPLLREAYETRRRVLGPDDPDSLGATNNLGALYFKRGKPAEAEPYFREAAEGYERTLGIRFETAQMWSNVADALLAQERYADAVPVYQKALGILDRITPEEGRGLRTQIAGQLAKLYTEWGKPEEAAKWAPPEAKDAPPPGQGNKL